MSTFVDTSAWYAAADRRDRSNARAKRVLAVADELVTTDHILIETWTLLHHRLGPTSAKRFWEGLRGGVALVETVSPADLDTAWLIGEMWPDHDFSIVDRTSFAVMQRLGIERAASFDSDFAIFRYGRGRRQAFTVLR